MKNWGDGKIFEPFEDDLLHIIANPTTHLSSFQVRTICRDFGVVCIRREGQDIGKIISDDEILYEYKVILVPGLALLLFDRYAVHCFYGVSFSYANRWSP